MYIEKNNLNEEIDFYRRLLHISVDLYGFNSDITLKISRDLDRLINSFYEIA